MHKRRVEFMIKQIKEIIKTKATYDEQALAIYDVFREYRADLFEDELIKIFGECAVKRVG